MSFDQIDLFIGLYSLIGFSILCLCVYGLLRSAGFFKCFAGEHSMHLSDMSARDKDGMINWPCQRCGQVQRVAYGLAARGEITQKRLKAQP